VNQITCSEVKTTVLFINSFYLGKGDANWVWSVGRARGQDPDFLLEHLQRVNLNETKSIEKGKMSLEV
jgi:hypothetical protein